MRLRIIALALGSFTLSACLGQTSEEASPGDPPVTTPSDPYAPCTDEATCCTAAEKVCTGDPDTGMTCTCYKVWDCSNPKKCQAPLLPPGEGSWSCTWTSSTLTCTGGSSSTPPTGGNGWTCTKNANGSFTCTSSPPNPANKPEGTSVWGCVVQSGFVICDRTDPTTPPVTPPVTPPATPVENCSDGCENDGDGLVDCKDSDCPACKPPTAQCHHERSICFPR